jgi:hypothetical protein
VTTDDELLTEALSQISRSASGEVTSLIMSKDRRTFRVTFRNGFTREETTFRIGATRG